MHYKIMTLTGNTWRVEIYEQINGDFVLIKTYEENAGYTK